LKQVWHSRVKDEKHGRAILDNSSQAGFSRSAAIYENYILFFGVNKELGVFWHGFC
jgi:hypothetical protein